MYEVLEFSDSSLLFSKYRDGWPVLVRRQPACGLAPLPSRHLLNQWDVVPAGLEENIKPHTLPAAGLLRRVPLREARNKPFRSLAVFQDLFTSTALSAENQ